MSTKAELIKRCEELGISTEGLTNNDEREAAIAAKEAELAAEAEAEAQRVEAERIAAEEAEAQRVEAERIAAEEAEAQRVEAERIAAEEAEAQRVEADRIAAEEAEALRVAAEEQEKEADVYEDDRGRKWQFKTTAPKTLNIDGHPMSQEEILSTEEVISELVYGNCGHLTQIL